MFTLPVMKFQGLTAMGCRLFLGSDMQYNYIFGLANDFFRQPAGLQHLYVPADFCMLPPIASQSAFSNLYFFPYASTSVT